jgi:phenylalanyl-tRNA synthetase beta chain
VLREEDVIEEIVRVYGMNNVPMPSQMRLALVQGEAFNKQAAQRNIADMLASNGLCEMMAVSLSQSGYYADDLLGIDAENLVRVNNTANMHLDIMRPTMLPSGLEAISHNLNRQQTEVRLYEFGKTYRQLPTDDDNSSVDARYKETSHLSIFLTGKAQPEHWTNKSNNMVGFFDLKTQVLAVLARLGVKNYQEEQVQGLPFASALRFFRGAQTLVTFGKVSPRIARKFDVKQEVWYADFNWDAMLSAASGSKTAYAEVSKFPSVRRDLALVLDRATTFADIAKAVNKAGKPLLRDIRLFDVYEDESKLGEGKKSYAIALTLEDAQRTLQDKDVDAVMAKIESSLAAQLGATVRR